MSQAELIVEEARLEELAGAWDALAVANAEPASGPAWMLGWWRHVAPSGSQLRVVAVHDHDELIGIFPLCTEPAEPHRYRLLAHDFGCCVTPLAMPGRAWETAELTGRVLATAEPRPCAIELAPMPAVSPWVMALRERWPGYMRPIVYRTELYTVPTISLHGRSFDAWVQGCRPHFRANLRRYQRRFGEAGGNARFSTAETMAADTETFVKLHAARGAGRGASRYLRVAESLPAFLGGLAGDLLAAGRFRLLILEIDGEPICAEFCIAGGGETLDVSFGWDERFKRLSPRTLSGYRMIEEAFSRGEDRFNLGRGLDNHKGNLADGADVSTSEVLLPAGPLLGSALARAAPRVARERIKQALSEEETSSVRSLLRRARLSPG
jgi:CelD/BcsL family acetyltransferase involved in cellulose biosynthesis